MQLNGYNLQSRTARPNTDSRIALEIFFMNDGAYIDPTEIVDVCVFSASRNLYPSSLLDEDGLLDNSAVSGDCLAYFRTSGSTYLEEEEYAYGSPDVFRIKQGHYVVVLDNVTLSATTAPRFNDEEIATTASSVGEYIDVWTVLLPNTSDYKTVFQYFKLDYDTFYSLPERLLVKTHNSLTTKKIQLGSKADLKILTEFTIENRNIDKSIVNLFKTALAVNPQIQIRKINDDINIPARVDVSGWSDTSALIDVTAENTFIFTWDTSLLTTHPELLTGNLGNMRGIYSVQVRYDLLSETIYSPLFFVQLN